MTKNPSSLGHSTYFILKSLFERWGCLTSHLFEENEIVQTKEFCDKQEKNVLACAIFVVNEE